MDNSLIDPILAAALNEEKTRNLLLQAEHALANLSTNQSNSPTSKNSPTSDSASNIVSTNQSVLFNDLNETQRRLIARFAKCWNFTVIDGHDIHNEQATSSPHHEHVSIDSVLVLYSDQCKPPQWRLSQHVNQPVNQAVNSMRIMQRTPTNDGRSSPSNKSSRQSPRPSSRSSSPTNSQSNNQADDEIRARLEEYERIRAQIFADQTNTSSKQPNEVAAHQRSADNQNAQEIGSSRQSTRPKHVAVLAGLEVDRNGEHYFNQSNHQMATNRTKNDAHLYQRRTPVPTPSAPWKQGQPFYPSNSTPYYPAFNQTVDPPINQNPTQMPYNPYVMYDYQSMYNMNGYYNNPVHQSVMQPVMQPIMQPVMQSVMQPIPHTATVRNHNQRYNQQSSAKSPVNSNQLADQAIKNFSQQSYSYSNPSTGPSVNSSANQSGKSSLTPAQIEAGFVEVPQTNRTINQRITPSSNQPVSLPLYHSIGAFSTHPSISAFAFNPSNNMPAYNQSSNQFGYGHANDQSNYFASYNQPFSHPFQSSQLPKSQTNHTNVQGSNNPVQQSQQFSGQATDRFTGQTNSNELHARSKAYATSLTNNHGYVNGVSNGLNSLPPTQPGSLTQLKNMSDSSHTIVQSIGQSINPSSSIPFGSPKLTITDDSDPILNINSLSINTSSNPAINPASSPHFSSVCDPILHSPSNNRSPAIGPGASSTTNSPPVMSAISSPVIAPSLSSPVSHSVDPAQQLSSSPSDQVRGAPLFTLENRFVPSTSQWLQSNNQWSARLDELGHLNSSKPMNWPVNQPAKKAQSTDTTTTSAQPNTSNQIDNHSATVVSISNDHTPNKSSSSQTINQTSGQSVDQITTPSVATTPVAVGPPSFASVLRTALTKPSPTVVKPISQSNKQSESSVNDHQPLINQEDKSDIHTRPAKNHGVVNDQMNSSSDTSQSALVQASVTQSPNSSIDSSNAPSSTPLKASPTPWSKIVQRK